MFDVASITVDGHTIAFSPIPNMARNDSTRASATRPFRVKNLQAFVKALMNDQGALLEGLYLHVINGLDEDEETPLDLTKGAEVALSAEDGSWEVSIPDLYDGGILANMEALGKLVQPHLEDGEVAVFEFVHAVPMDVELGYCIHAINWKGETYSRDEQSLVKEILQTLGATERTSDVRLFEV